MAQHLPTLTDPQLTKNLTAPTGSMAQTLEDLSTTSIDNEPSNNPVFKAVGVIQGEVTINETGTNTITINGQEYNLRYAAAKHQALVALKLEIKKSGSNFQRLIVYPRVIHFPRKEQPHAIYFELVGFLGASVQDRGIFNELDALEFKLSGLWQFIPVCRVPCVSIFRNFSEARKLFVKQSEPYIRVRFMKASHLPLYWKDSSIRPFRFNPKLGKDQNQGRAMFIQVKAKFNPEHNSFEFIEQLAQPLAEAPQFLKAGKKDKAEAGKKVAAPKTPKPIESKKLAAPNPPKPTPSQPIPKPKLIRPSKPVRN